MRWGARIPVIAALATLATATLAKFTDAADGPDPAPASHVVKIEQARFEPTEMSVVVGDTVVWVNHGIVPHTVTASEFGWESGTLRNADEWRLVVQTEGTFPYRCTYHPTMHGTIVVRHTR